MTPIEVELQKWTSYCHKQAHKFEPAFPLYDLDDVYQIAMIGAWEALVKYDPTKTPERAKPGYMARRIRMKVTQQFNNPASGIGTKANRNSKKIKAALDTYSSGIEGEVARIAGELRVKESTVSELLKAREYGRNRTVTRLRGDDGEGGTGIFDALELCASDAPSPDTAAAARRELEAFIGTARTTRETYILTRVALEDTYTAIGKQLGLSTERIRQIVYRCKVEYLNTTLTCPVCDREYAQHRRDQAFCSNKCSRENSANYVCDAPGCATIVTEYDRNRGSCSLKDYKRRFCSTKCFRGNVYRDPRTRLASGRTQCKSPNESSLPSTTL